MALEIADIEMIETFFKYEALKVNKMISRIQDKIV